VITLPREFKPRRNAIIISLTAVVAITTYLLLPESFNELQRRMVAIFLVAAIFWGTEALPLFATSLLVIGFEILFLAEKGGLAKALPQVSFMPDIHLSYFAFINSFGSGIIILFMGGFLLSRALTKHGVDEIISVKLLKPIATSPAKLLFGVLAITAFFSMWMSNTATAAMMLAILTPIIKELPHNTNFRTALILAVPFGANIGGVGTPIGSPPNAIAFEALEKAGTGFSITFFEWMRMAVPLELIMLILSGCLLYYFYKPEYELKFSEAQEPPELTGKGAATLVILGIGILLWLTGGQTGIAPAVVALMIAAALTAFGILSKSDVDSIDWNILILMWGGLSLGTAISLSGLSDLIYQIEFDAVPGGLFGVSVIIVCIAVTLSTFMSNTATANLIIPISLSLSVGTDETRATYAIIAALACSFAMAMPVSTPPNAIAFSTGRIKVKDLFLTGGIITTTSIIAILFGYHFIFPGIMGW